MTPNMMLLFKKKLKCSGFINYRIIKIQSRRFIYFEIGNSFMMLFVKFGNVGSRYDVIFQY